MTDVVEASGQTPVLVDFWAPWCGPCKQLMPILDRLAAQYAGRVKLAKVNTDEQQELAQQIGVRSLPTVVLFKDRTVVDHFIGVVPEAQIREMLDKHLPKTVDSPVQQAQQLKAAGDFAGARRSCRTSWRAIATTSTCRRGSPSCRPSTAISMARTRSWSVCKGRTRRTLR